MQQLGSQSSIDASQAAAVNAIRSVFIVIVGVMLQCAVIFWIPIQFGWWVILVGAFFGVSVSVILLTSCRIVWTPDVNRREAKIRGRYARRRAPPDRSVYDAIVNLSALAREPVRSYMRYRGAFRSVIKERPLAGLLFCLYDDDPRIQRLAIFMLALCKPKGVERDFVEFAKSEHRYLRKRAIMGLRRLNAWPALQRIAGDETDLRLQQLARFEHRTIEERWKRMEVHLTAPPVEPPKTPLKVYAEVPVDPIVLPKTGDQMREVLERIRALRQGTKSRR